MCVCTCMCMHTYCATGKINTCMCMHACMHTHRHPCSFFLINISFLQCKNCSFILLVEVGNEIIIITTLTSSTSAFYTHDVSVDIALVMFPVGLFFLFSA